MFVILLLITLVNQCAMGSPFHFPDESSSSNKENHKMILPGIYFHPSPKSGKSLDFEENSPVPISFGSSEPVVRLPSLTSIMFSPSRGDPPKQNEPAPVHSISFGEEPVDAAIGFNNGTPDKTDAAAEVNVPMLFFDEPIPDEIIDRHNNKPIVIKPVLAATTTNTTEKEHTLERGFHVVIVIEDEPIEAFFINSTNDQDNSENDTNLIQTSSESPKLMFINPIEDESTNDDVESSHFLFPTPKSTDVTEDIQRSPVILNSPNINNCASGHMLYNDTCYQLLTSGPCGNNSWLISKDGYSAECEQRQCGVDNEVFFNNTCVIDTPNINICPLGFKLNINQSGIGNCQCDSGHMFYQGKCHRFLTSGFGLCGEENWLILRDLNNAECAPRPCSFGKILYNNRCVDPTNSTVCGSGQMLYVDLTGDAFCDCEPDFIYLPSNGSCIPEYEQGYCGWGEYLVRNEEEIPECVPNICGRDHTVYHNGTGSCYKKKYIGFCNQEFLEIKGDEAECAEMELDPKNIFEVPTLRRCPRGSARDVLHECRKRFTMPSMSSVLTAKHLYGGCSRGWSKAPNGRCKKISNLFG